MYRCSGFFNFLGQTHLSCSFLRSVIRTSGRTHVSQNHFANSIPNCTKPLSRPSHARVLWLARINRDGCYGFLALQL